jgi:hypothetical protein
VRVQQYGDFGLAEHVDKTGGHNCVMGVDRFSRCCIRQLTNGGDTPGADADVAGIPGGSGAVDDMSVANDDIERLPGSNAKQQK